jgi:hypothetical protein
MMTCMKAKLLGRVVPIVAGLVVLLAPVIAMAQEDENSKIYDARLEGYPGNVTLDSSSTALLWLLLIVLAAACVGVMFKNARRTHLD